MAHHFERLARRHWRLILRILLCSAALQLFGAFTPVLSGLIVNRLVAHEIPSLALLFAGIAGVVALLQGLSGLVRSHLVALLRTHVDYDLIAAFFVRFLSLPTAFSQTRPASYISQRLSSVLQARDLLSSALVTILYDGGMVLIYLTLACLVELRIGLVLVALGLVMGIAVALTRPTARRLALEQTVLDAESQSYQMEAIYGIETIKTLGIERSIAQHWIRKFELSLASANARLAHEGMAESFIGALKWLSPSVVLIYGYQLALDGRISTGTLFTTVTLAAGFMAPLNSFMNTAHRFGLLRSHFERIDDVMQAATEPAGPVKPVRVASVEFRHVSFRYTSDSPCVLTDVCLRIEPKEFVAIIGRSGAGKSTLAALLCGLYRSYDGEILIDGIELRDYDPIALRSHLGVVTQNVHIFRGSIYNNIDLDRELPEDAIVQAAARACVHDDILALPMGYATVLADRGLSLSGGQRQRLALARAVAANPGIMLLDEATSALDLVTERAVHDSLRAAECTRVVVSHRPSAASLADRVVVLDHGRIVSCGRPVDLGKTSSAYSQLMESSS